MIFNKVSIFLSLTLSTIYTSVSAHDNQKTNPGPDCVCFERRPEDYQVRQIIEPHQGLERLVLVIYRDVITNKVDIYIPNLETQNLIPDLKFRNDNELTLLLNETICSILNNSPKTHVQASSSEPFNVVKGTTTKSIDIVVMENEKDGNLLNVHKVDYERYTPYVAPSNYMSINQIEDERPLNIIPDIEFQDNQFKLPYNAPSKYINVNQIQDQQPLYVKPGEDSEKWKHNVPFDYVNVNHIGNQEPIYITPTENSNKREHYIPSNYINGNQIGNQEPIIYVTPTENSDKWKHNVATDVVPDIKLPEHQYKWPHNYNVPVDYTKYVEQITDHSDQQHRGSIISVQIPAILKYPYNSPALIQQVQGPFSEWIKKQMKTIYNHKYPGNSNIDINIIGNSILRIIYENGMYVTDKGVLIDAYGTVLDINMLSLRPILVGDTVHLNNNNILQGNEELFQKNLPYTEAILVTTPHKVLGVIPTSFKTLTHIWESNPNVSVTKTPTIPSALNYLAFENTIANNHHSKDKKLPSRMKTVKSPHFKYVEKINEKQASYDPEHYDKVPDVRKPKKHNKSQKKSDRLSVKQKQNKINKANRQRHERQDYDDKISNKNIVIRSYPDQQFHQGRELTTSETPADAVFTKGLYAKDLSSLDRGQNYFNQRFLLPGMGIFNEPVGIISKNQRVPIDILFKRLNNAAGSHVSGLKSESMEISHRRENIPIINAMDSRNYIPGDVPKSFESKKPHVSNQSGNKRAVTGTEPLLPSRKNWQNDYKLHQLRHSNGRTSDVADLVFEENPEFQSRNGMTVPKEVGDANNNEQLSASLVEGEDDDDDDDGDGDFRIIGGHAATGSGTPLSNRGRSGQLY